jgi:hypothetical protein
MRTHQLTLLILAVSIPAAAQAPEQTRPPHAAAENVLTEHGFAAPVDIRFDESLGNQMPTPRLPKDWRFVGVSNGVRTNSNNLWFQDSSGNIYLIQGSNSPTKTQFIMSRVTQVLRVQ